MREIPYELSATCSPTARSRPIMELPFAGHPTLGTAFVLAARRGLGPPR